MADSGDSSTSRLLIRDLLARLERGEPGVREHLIELISSRLQTLAQFQLRRFPAVHRWEQTDDIANRSAMRLYAALQDVHPRTVRDLVNLCGEMIRRELIDLWRHYFGPEGMGAHHATAAGREGSSGMSSPSDARSDPSDRTYDPAALAEWGEFHERVGRLRPELKEAFNFLWYHGLSQEDAAAELGVSVPTIKRRWREARLELGQFLRQNGISDRSRNSSRCRRQH